MIKMMVQDIKNIAEGVGILIGFSAGFLIGFLVIYGVVMGADGRPFWMAVVTITILACAISFPIAAVYSGRHGGAGSQDLGGGADQ
jgi:hypothetical protein